MGAKEQPLPDVRPGQVWADNDKRSAGRKVKVVEVFEREGGEPWAKVEIIAVAANALPLTKPRFSSIAVKRFKPNSTGYRLVSEARPTREGDA